jgi:glycosyltransferase involved in cell wall biosynthesis
VKLFGQNDNILQVMNGLDIFIQSSRYGEGFPNVVAESMACGTPCIVTDVGDAAFIVGKTGWVVPPKNPIKLAKVIEKVFNELSNKNWNKRCYKARLRIKENFSIGKMLQSYNEVWSKAQSKN